MKYLWVMMSWALLFAPASVLAAPMVYPVPEVMGFTQPELEKKAPAFAAWVKATGVPRLSGEFVATLKKEFGPIAVDKIDNKNKHNVLVASLHLVRASHYTIPKSVSQCTEHQLPITLSLMFTNPSTGDVLYSFTETSYAPVEVHDSEQAKQCDLLLQSSTADNYARLLQRLIHKAHEGYNPSQIEASVAKLWKGLYILGKGSKFGIARDDNLTDAAGNEIQVIYVTENYAVAVPLIASGIQIGAKFSKYANQSLGKTIKKPKVITMQDGWGDEQLKTIARYFDSELSKESAFTLLPVNESFAAVLSALSKESDAGQFQTTNQRPLPDYLIKFSASRPRSYSVSQQGKFGVQVYEQYILGELLDKQGRIIYSAVAEDRIEDKDVAGMVFSQEARLEVLLKNAVKRLAEEFSHSIKFSNFTLPVTGVEGNVVQLQDTARQLHPKDTVQVYRNIGSVEGISGDVLVPVWLVEIQDVSDGAVRGALLLPVANEVKEVEVSKEDVVIVDSISAGAQRASNTSVTYCKGVDPKLGDLEIDDFGVLSRVSGYLLPYSLYDNDSLFFGKIAEAVKYGGFNKSTLKLGQVDTAGRCLQPVYKAAVATRQCEEGDCDASVRLGAGYRLYAGQDKKGGAASETNLSIKQVRESSLAPVIQGEASKHVLNLLKSNIEQVHYK